MTGYAGQRTRQVEFEELALQSLREEKRMGPQGMFLIRAHHTLYFLLLLPQDELLDIIYWMRQLIAILVGITWGTIPVYGIVGLLL